MSRISLRPFNTFGCCAALTAASAVAPTEYELAINLKTSKTLDLTVPTSLLARMTEVID
jgi:hypothetical protein